MPPKKPIRLVFNLTPSGIHDAAWKLQDDAATLSTDVDQLVQNAITAESGKLDAVFMPDDYGSLRLDDPPRRPWRALDPTVVFSAIAVATEHIGLIQTINGVYGTPYQVARSVASLDHLSRGRAGWNVITSTNAHALDALGLGAIDPRTEKYERAEEFLSIVHGLWDSLPQAAIVADPDTHAYVDLGRARPVDQRGKHFSSRGILQVPPYGGNKPVIVLAGASQASKELGARWADVLFTAHRTVESARRFTEDARTLVEQRGRSRDDVVVLPGVLPMLGSTEAEAHALKRELDERLDVDLLLEALAARLGVGVSSLDLAKPLPYGDIEIERAAPYESQLRANIVQEALDKDLTTHDVLLNNITGGHRVVVGTPEQLADDFERWVDSDAADGFAFNVETNPRGINAMVEGLVPELQKRGRFRTEYDGTTLRDNLGVGAGTRHSTT